MKIDLLKIPIIKRLLKLRSFQFIAIYPNLVIFILIILTGLYGIQIGNKNFSIMMVWILWWSALMMLMVPFFSRLWCIICPLPGFGEWAHRRTLTEKKEKRFGLSWSWPKRLDNIWIQNIAFLAFASFQGILITRPWATAYLMLLLFALGFLFALLFKDRAFCRYVCPVSGFIGLYSNFSTLELRIKDKDICMEDIRITAETKRTSLVPRGMRTVEKLREAKPVSWDESHVTCIAGNKDGYGCPWFEYPHIMNRNAYCGLCMECIKTCPYDNIALNIRMGGEDLFVKPWGRIERGFDEAWKSFIMVTLAFLYGLVFMGPYAPLKDMANMVSLGEWSILTIILWASSLLVTPAVFFLFVALSKALSGAKEIPLKRLFINYSYTLVPIGLLAWIAFSIAILFVNGSYLVSVVSDPFGWGWNLLGSKHYPWQPFYSGLMPYAQIFILLSGLYFSIKAAYKISIRTFPTRNQALKGFIPIMAMLTALTIILLWLWVG